MALKIDKVTAKKLYPNVPEWYQKEMVTEFGEEFFKEEGYESIKTFDDACRAIGTTEKEFNEKFSTLGLDIDTFNYEKIKVVAKSINNGWVPDWSNRNQYKYYPWFEVLSSGFGFSSTTYDYTAASTTVGSRLCFESSEQAKYAGTQFTAEYKQFLL